MYEQETAEENLKWEKTGDKWWNKRRKIESNEENKEQDKKIRKREFSKREKVEERVRKWFWGESERKEKRKIGEWEGFEGKVGTENTKRITMKTKKERRVILTQRKTEWGIEVVWRRETERD